MFDDFWSYGLDANQENGMFDDDDYYKQYNQMYDFFASDDSIKNMPVNYTKANAGGSSSNGA